MKKFNYMDVEPESLEEGKGVKRRWLITRETGAENFFMRLYEVEPGGFTPLHSHPWEHEVFILEGEGVAVGGSEECELREGDVLFIPSGEPHQLRNESDKILKFLCLIPAVG